MNTRSRFKSRFVLPKLFAFVVACPALLATQPAAAAEIFCEAFAGEPFGVGHVTLSLDPTLDRSLIKSNCFSIHDSEGRVLYPTVSKRRVLGMLRDLVGTANPGGTSRITIWFLFQGDKPFDVVVRTPQSFRARVVPAYRPLRHRVMMDRWWRQYTSTAKSQIRSGDYPPVVESYLTAMLGKRLGMDLDRALTVTRKQSSLENDLLRLLFNTESLRIEALRDRMLTDRAAEQATLPLPTGPNWPDEKALLPVSKGTIEPIAHVIPSDWFYIRYGNFDNYLWLKDLIRENGGDLSSMVTMRGHDPLISTKMQVQLGLRESAMAEVLGGTVISDLAIVGRDTYTREGAAIGIVFEARTSLLGRDIEKQRKQAVEQLADPKASVETIQIAGHDVSFASSPDNRLRSFYVAKDQYHLVTNCRAMVRQFLASGKKLSEANDFRRARAAHKSDDESTAFVYFSRDFFRNMLSPHYQIELRRRLNSTSEIELMQLAKQAAIAEGFVDTSIESLIRAGLLPKDFGQRADGSRLVAANGRIRDSRRGFRGFFLPIPDVQVDTISPSEKNILDQISDFQRTRWHDMDAVAIDVRRQKADKDNHVHISFDAKLDPFSPVKYGRWASIIGPPKDIRIVQPENTIIRAQASLQGGQILPNTGEHMLFLGVRDEPANLDLGRGRIRQAIQILRSSPAYLGAWPKAGLLDLLRIGGAVIQDEEFERLPLGLLRWQDDQFSVVGFDRDTLRKSVQELGVEERSEIAQLHVYVGDLVHSQLRDWFRKLNYQRALDTSIGNTRMLATVSQQLRVPPEKAREFVEQVLAIRLTCPLGGEYELTEFDGGKYWQSTAWHSGSDVPDDFSTPLSAWFRGLRLDGNFDEHTLRLTGTVTMERKKQPKSKASFFNFFGVGN